MSPRAFVESGLWFCPDCRQLTNQPHHECPVRMRLNTSLALACLAGAALWVGAYLAYRWATS